MKKVLLLTLLSIGMVVSSMQKSVAQDYEQGSIVANLGVGLGGGLGIPVSLSVEYGLKEKISVGGFLGYASEKEDFGFFEAKYSYLLIGARGAYHFDLDIDKLDPYAGVLLGYNAASFKLDPDPGPPFNNISVGGVIYGGFAGARYSITDKFGAFGEIGYGLGLITVGATMKF